MAKNIADKQVELKKVHRQIMRCTICNARKNGLLVPGEGNPNADVVFVGEAPGRQEVKTGRPFIGPAGKILRGLIEKLGLTAEDVFITSAVKYLPSYVTPKLDDIEHGRTHLFKQLAVIEPKVIVLLGNVAAQAVLGESFAIAKQHGTLITRDSLHYFLNYHPAAPLYSPKIREVLEKDFKKLKRLLQKTT